MSEQNVRRVMYVAIVLVLPSLLITLLSPEFYAPDAFRYQMRILGPLSILLVAAAVLIRSRASRLSAVLSGCACVMAVVSLLFNFL